MFKPLSFISTCFTSFVKRDTEAFPITSLSSSPPPVVPCIVIVPPFITVSAPNSATSTPSAVTVIPALPRVTLSLSPSAFIATELSVTKTPVLASLPNIVTPSPSIVTVSDVSPWAPPIVQVVPLSSAIVVSLSINLKDVASTTICSVANVPTVTSLVRNALSVNKPNPPRVPTLALDNPLRSPSLAFNSIS